MSKVVAALGASFFLLAIMLIVGMDLSFDHALLLLTGLLLVAVFGSMAAYQQIKNRDKKRLEGKSSGSGSHRGRHRSGNSRRSNSRSD
jgi:ABC-type Fe3+-siderophore transport system permease subunit